jgi:putative transposase
VYNFSTLICFDLKKIMVISFNGIHFENGLTLVCVWWCVAYSLSYRQIEDMMQERLVSVHHATINRWVLKCSPQLEAAFHRTVAQGIA